MTLRADTVVLSPGGDPSAPPAVDPYDLAGDEGIVMVDGSLTLVGLGRARTLTLDGGLADDSAVADIGHWLAGLPCTDPLRRPGTGVVAFGALPFDRHEPAGLVVPEVVYGRADDGTEWLTVVTGGDDDGDSRRLSPTDHRNCPPTPPTCGPGSLPEPGGTPSGHRRRTGRGPVASRSWPGSARARPTGRSWPSPRRPWRPSTAVRSTRWSWPGRSTSRPPGRSTSRRCSGAGTSANRPARSSPCRRRTVAGSWAPVLSSSWPAGVSTYGAGRWPAPRGDGDGPDGSRLLDSSKDTLEHRYVTEFIAGVLAPLCRELDVPEHPELAHLHSVTHLATPIAGVLDGDPGRSPGGDDGVPSALALVAALHPTPAVGGVPREAALTMIAAREHPRRDHYAGPVGWTDARGDGTWVVGIRAVTVHGTTARLAAGVGIVGASDPGAELSRPTGSSPRCSRPWSPVRTSPPSGWTTALPPRLPAGADPAGRTSAGPVVDLPDHRGQHRGGVPGDEVPDAGHRDELGPGDGGGQTAGRGRRYDDVPIAFDHRRRDGDAGQHRVIRGSSPTSATCSVMNVSLVLPQAPSTPSVGNSSGNVACTYSRAPSGRTRDHRRIRGSNEPIPTRPALVSTLPSTRTFSSRSRKLMLSGVQIDPTSTSPRTSSG